MKIDFIVHWLWGVNMAYYQPCWIAYRQYPHARWHFWWIQSCTAELFQVTQWAPLLPRSNLVFRVPSIFVHLLSRAICRNLIFSSFSCFEVFQSCSRKAYFDHRSLNFDWRKLVRLRDFQGIYPAPRFICFRVTALLSVKSFCTLYQPTASSRRVIEALKSGVTWGANVLLVATSQ